jgi:Rod binding domain-containing protein
METTGLPMDMMAAIARPIPGADMLSRAPRLTASEIDRTAREFEAMTLQQMLNFMMESVDLSDTPFGGGLGERAFKPMMVEEYGKAFAANGGIGIADAVRREMLKMQEVPANPNAPTSSQPNPQHGA